MTLFLHLKIFEQKLNGQIRVRLDSTHPGSCENDYVRFLFRKKQINSRLRFVDRAANDHGSGRLQNPACFSLRINCAPDEASMASNKYLVSFLHNDRMIAAYHFLF
jgi:hypothetical protein